MNVIGLDDKTYTWNLSKYKPKNKCSKLHLRARQLLQQEFPCEKIYEELMLPGTKNERQIRPLFADFFVPYKSLMIEVQGEQHYKFNSFFFHNKLEFYKAQSRDRNKQRWCQINHFILICLPFNELDEQWLIRIRNRQ
jgi:hypothetical protein